VATKYLLPCSCGQKIPVEKAQAGQTIRCLCGMTLDIPGMQALSRLEEAETTPPQFASPWGARQRILLIGSVLTIIAFGFLSYFYVLYRPERFDATKYCAMEAWTLWISLRAGIDQPPNQFDMAFMRALYVRKLYLGASVVFLGLALLVLSSAFFFPKRPVQLEKED